MTTDLCIPEMDSILETTLEKGCTKKDCKTVKNTFEETVKNQYQNIYRITREGFGFFSGRSRNSDLELIAEFDSISGELTKFEGWLDTEVDGDDESSRAYAQISLTPVKTKTGLIYHFKGTLTWSNKFNNAVEPLSVVPVYGVPSGRIIELKPTRMGESKIFDKSIVEYRSLDLKLGR